MSARRGSAALSLAPLLSVPSRWLPLPLPLPLPLAATSHPACDSAARRECLVPLLDMCNHRAGCTTQVSIEQSGGRSWYVIRAGRSLRRGDEVLLNYGAKGNAELLRSHGFVVRTNPADVCEVDLHLLPAMASPPLLGGDAESRLKLALSLGRGGLRTFLFHGELPPMLLPLARVICASDGAELDAALSVARGEELPVAEADGGSSNAFDWSVVDWDAEDPFAACSKDLPSCPAGEACEARALAALQALIRSKLVQLPPHSVRSAVETGQPEGGGVGCDVAVAVGCEAAADRRGAASTYVEGQRALLEGAAHSLSCLQHKLPRTSVPTV